MFEDKSHRTHSFIEKKRHKLRTDSYLHFYLVQFFNLFFFLIRNDAYKIMVDCPSCTSPSIHLFMALGRLSVVHIPKLSLKK